MIGRLVIPLSIRSTNCQDTANVLAALHTYLEGVEPRPPARYHPSYTLSGSLEVLKDRKSNVHDICSIFVSVQSDPSNPNSYLPLSMPVVLVDTRLLLVCAYTQYSQLSGLYAPSSHARLMQLKALMVLEV